jgi:heat shock protein HslJ
VVCNKSSGVCYDRFGPSIGLTEAFLGPEPAQRLTDALREQPVEHAPGAIVTPAPGIECVRETGPCKVKGELHKGLTSALYGPWPARSRSAEAAAIIDGEWGWVVTRYSDDSVAQPADPASYTLRLKPDSSLSIRADCNRVGGRYVIEESTISIEMTHSTLVACEPDSLDSVFLRDLAAARVFFLRRGKLFLDLKYDTGTMEFSRQTEEEATQDFWQE